MARPIYTEAAPPAGLASLVLSAWQFEVPVDVEGAWAHEVPPDGCTSLVWAENVVLVMGPRLDALAVPMPAGSVVHGLRLWPDATRAVTGVAAEALRGVVAPASLVAPGLVVSATEPWRVTAALPGVLDPRVRKVVEAVMASGGTTSLGALAAAVGLCERQVQRRFRREVGLTVKEFSRIRRFREAAARVLVAEHLRWGEVAYAVGYADQAHLSREVSSFMGQTPGAFRRWIQGMEHRDVQP